MRDVYFDYDLQVWVRAGKIARCGHPENMSTATTACCNGSRFAGLTVIEARELEQVDKAKREIPGHDREAILYTDGTLVP